MISPEACSERVYIFTVAAQFTLGQDKIDTILHHTELDSYLFTLGEAQKTLTIFSISKMHVKHSQMISRKRAVLSRKMSSMLGWCEVSLRMIWVMLCTTEDACE